MAPTNLDLRDRPWASREKVGHPELRYGYLSRVAV